MGIPIFVCFEKTELDVSASLDYIESQRLVAQIIDFSLAEFLLKITEYFRKSLSKVSKVARLATLLGI